MICSAFWMVVRRCAITTVVRLTVRVLSAACTERSVMLSRAEVASSRSTSGGFLSRQRAMATRCFSPPDSLRPRSPTMVLKPSGRDLMKRRICALSQARSISSSVACWLPYATLWRMVSLKSTVSCGTTPIALRSDFCVTCFISWSDTSTLPTMGS
mmetsp:Transcript_14382/g.36423  ORF Transcript_14382/g.36423 Transcript_14382/m.36423 type:complete len:156 (+) Transcript_14382:1146-1613(+)